LAITHVLGATDLHEDNLLANGEHPVLLDLETLVTPIVARFETDDRLQYSVFDTGLLPSFLPEGPNGEPRLSGGIGGGLTDAAPTNNLPRLGDDGPVVAPFGYLEDVLRGFRISWRRICNDRRSLLERSSAIKDSIYRFVLRPTHDYWRALVQALATTDARDVRAFRIALARGLPLRSELRDPAAALGHELASLAVLDIPSFVGAVGSRAIRAAGDDAPLFEVEASPWEALSARVSALKQEDEERHLARVAAAFATAGHSYLQPPVSPPSRRSGTARPLDAARAIAARLENVSLETREGGLEWLGPRRLDRHWQLARVEVGLGRGRAGIAVFFAAMARCTGESRYRDVALRGLSWQAASRRALSAQDPAPKASSGIASVAYALTLTGQLLEDASLLEDARAWAALVPAPTGHRLEDCTLAGEHVSELCRGAPGRNLAHVRAGGPLDPLPAWPHEDVEAPHDHLCCGNASLVDMTLELGRLSGDASYVARSRALAARLSARVSSPADYRLPLGPSCQRPGLFDGLAGIGYMWLRQVEPQLPCVLLWDTLVGR
jgi:lantibiotic modifying enzyme